MPLHIVIIGGGIAGLSAAGFLRANHTVTVLEKGTANYDAANDYGFSVVANAFNLLVKAGIDTTSLNMVVMTHLWQRTFSNDEIVTIDFDTRKTFGGAPSVLAKRALVQAELLRFATSSDFPGQPAVVIENARVESVDAVTGTVVTTDGQSYTGDLIIGADGINSVVRPVVLSSHEDARISTPHSGRTNDLLAFMTQVPISVLQGKNIFLSDPSNAAGLVNWYSPGGQQDKKRVLAYHISPTEIQVVGYAAEKEFAAQFEQSKASIIKNVNSLRAQSEYNAEFDESIWSLFGHRQVDAWRIRDAEPIDSWIKGKVLLIGDAAHAVTPHAGQGCNMSIEDSEALGYVLRDVDTSSQLPQALDVFMRLRKERTQGVARFSRHMGGLMSKEEAAQAPIMTREEHSAKTYGYQGAEHALQTMELSAN